MSKHIDWLDWFALASKGLPVRGDFALKGCMEKGENWSRYTEYKSEIIYNHWVRSFRSSSHHEDKVATDFGSACSC